ncbi:hypothetical protein GCM10018963_64070 [Saccharothrix longispora]
MVKLRVDDFPARIESSPGASRACPSSAIGLSSSHLQFLVRELTSHRRRIGSKGWELDPGRRALPVLAHLRCGGHLLRIAAGFGIGLVLPPAATFTKRSNSWPPSHRI